jgi:hypothetical protein
MGLCDPGVVRSTVRNLSGDRLLMHGIMVVISLVSAIYGQAPPNSEEVLTKARDKMLERTERLPNYTCVQTIDRKYFKPAKPEFPVPSCIELSARTGLKNHQRKLEATDRLRLDVKVSNGTEIGAWAGAGNFGDGDVMKLIKGPFGTGGFGAFLTDIFAGSSVAFHFEGEESVDHRKLFRYRFQIAQDASHYMVHSGSEWIATGYSGMVWIDPNSFELRRLLVQAGELAEETGACESNSSVEYAQTRIGTGDFLLPQSSALHFLMRDTTESDVATTYSRCRQFLGEARLVTDPSVVASELPPAPATTGIPADLVVPLTLTRPIDTNTAAAGDVVVASVSEPLRDPKSSEVVIPARSIVRGRVLRMEHSLGPPGRFVIAIQLETVEIHGVTSPIYAIRLRYEEKPDVKSATSGLVERSHQIVLPPPGQSALVSNFSISSKAKHYVLPRGLRMQWITVRAPDVPQP